MDVSRFSLEEERTVLRRECHDIPFSAYLTHVVVSLARVLVSGSHLDSGKDNLAHLLAIRIRPAMHVHLLLTTPLKCYSIVEHNQRLRIHHRHIPESQIVLGFEINGHVHEVETYGDDGLQNREQLLLSVAVGDISKHYCFSLLNAGTKCTERYAELAFGILFIHWLVNDSGPLSGRNGGDGRTKRGDLEWFFLVDAEQRAVVSRVEDARALLEKRNICLSISTLATTMLEVVSVSRREEGLIEASIESSVVAIERAFPVRYPTTQDVQGGIGKGVVAEQRVVGIIALALWALNAVLTVKEGAAAGVVRALNVQSTAVGFPSRVGAVEPIVVFHSLVTNVILLTLPMSRVILSNVHHSKCQYPN